MLLGDNTGVYTTIFILAPNMASGGPSVEFLQRLLHVTPLGSWRHQLLQTLSAWNPKDGLVIDTDIDGQMSGCLLCHTFGTHVVGTYNTETLFVCEGHTKSDMQKALWVDLDVTFPTEDGHGVITIGNHIVQEYEDEHIPNRNPLSFNPNVFFKRSRSTCNWGKEHKGSKYPYATIHLLLGALFPDERYELGSRQLAWITHADSAFLNAHKEAFYENAKDWANMMFAQTQWMQTLVNGEYHSDTNARTQHIRLCDELKKEGLVDVNNRPATRNFSSIPPEWKRLCNTQGTNAPRYCDPEFEGTQERDWWNRGVLPLWNKICQEMGWCGASGKLGALSDTYHSIAGSAKAPLKKKGTLSHAYIFGSTVRYTIHADGMELFDPNRKGDEGPNRLGIGGRGDPTDVVVVSSNKRQKVE
jgi:hypothetical protein